MPAGINSIVIPEQYRLEEQKLSQNGVTSNNLELFTLNEVRPFLNVPGHQPELDPTSAIILDVETKQKDEVQEIMDRANNTAALMINTLDAYNKANEGKKKQDLVYQVPPNTGKWRRAEIVPSGKYKGDPTKSTYKIVIHELEEGRETDPRKRKNKRNEAIEIVCVGAVPDEQQVIGRGNYQVTGMYVRENGQNRQITQATEAEDLMNQRCIKAVTAERNRRPASNQPLNEQQVAELIRLAPTGFNSSAYGHLGQLISQTEFELNALEAKAQQPTIPTQELQELRTIINEKKQRLTAFRVKQKEVRQAAGLSENQELKIAERERNEALQAKKEAEAKAATALQAQKDTEAKLASALQLQKATEQAKTQLETTLKTTQEQLKQSAQLLVEMKQALDSANKLLVERQAEIQAYEKYAQAIEAGRTNDLMERAETAADQILEMIVQARQIKPGENPIISIGSIDTLQEYIKDNSTDKGFHENNIHLVSDTLELVALQMNNPKLFLEQLAKRQRATQSRANTQQQAQLAKYVSMIQNQMNPNNKDTRNIVDPYLIEEFIHTCNQAQMNEPIKKNTEAQARRERIRNDKRDRHQRREQEKAANRNRNQQYRDQQRANHRGPQSNQKSSTNSIN
jgi:hypothetical protein